jgi:hypothetical protein
MANEEGGFDRVDRKHQRTRCWLQTEKRNHRMPAEKIDGMND